MPQDSANAEPPRKRKRVLTGISREVTDEGLGDDLPWEWIYEGDLPPSRSAPKIVGARTGNFECRIGDIVMLKADRSNEVWVALIGEFVEDDGDGDMAANFMWFSTEKEIRSKAKKRSDFYWNEVYISPSWDINPLASINGKAKVMSLSVFLQRHPSGKIPRTSPDFGKSFVCRRGCNTRSATYTDEFEWEEVYRGEQDIHSLNEMVERGTKPVRRLRRAPLPTPKAAAAAEEEAYRGDEEKDHKDEEEEGGGEGRARPPQTPRKAIRSTAATPTSRRSQGRSAGKKLEFTPLATRKLDPSQVQASPFQMARSRLHVSAVPTSLPCRESEFALVYSHLEAAITEGTGNCIYISGTPGTGKTATVREVVSRLEEAVGADELDDFIFVEINGMKITDPHQAYSLLWEALKGERASPAQALDLLERDFGSPSPRRIPCVVLMDELDQLVTKNQAVMYNFFNWPTLRHSRLIVLAVANTMDLPERTLSNKISSRLGLTRITFPGYNHEQLMRIIQSRLEGIPGDMVDPDAVQFASRKVAAVSGDARRALDICRRAVEMAEGDVSGDPMTPSRKQREGGGGGGRVGGGRVTIATIKRAINEATSNPVQQHLRGLPLMSKLLMAALLLRIRRSGLVETTFGETLDELQRATSHVSSFGATPRMAQIVGSHHHTKGSASSSSSSSHALPIHRQSARPSHVHAAALELVAAGLVNLEAQRADRSSKLRLAIADDEVKMALRDDAELKAMGIGVQFL